MRRGASQSLENVTGKTSLPVIAPAAQAAG